MASANNAPMAPGTFSSAGTGPMWKRFMIEAHAYLQLPPRPFEKPDDVVISSCGGREEVFKVDQPATKPGACKSPARPGSGPTQIGRASCRERGSDSVGRVVVTTQTSWK